MTRALIFISGFTTASLICWYLFPLYTFAAFVCGVVAGVLLVGATLFIEASLTYMKEGK